MNKIFLLKRFGGKTKIFYDLYIYTGQYYGFLFDNKQKIPIKMESRLPTTNRVIKYSIKK